MIWYVEDEASIRDIGIYALSSAGFETKGFEDGISFWNALKKEKPELIVLDVMLPGMDGIEILTKMKGSVELNSIPVIMATAKGQEYDRIRGLDLGADDYIVNMREALILLDNTGRILSINPAAKTLFGIGSFRMGEDFLTIDRTQNMRLALDEANAHGHADFRTRKNGREYQFDLSRIDPDGKNHGMVILAFDITEQGTVSPRQNHHGERTESGNNDFCAL